MSGKRLWLWGIGMTAAWFIEAQLWHVLFGSSVPGEREWEAAVSVLVMQGTFLALTHLWRTYRVSVERREDREGFGE